MKQFAVILLCFLPFMAKSQTLTACRDSIKGGYDFWLYQPVNRDSIVQRKPLVIFLHGRSLSGRNLSRVLRYGIVDAINRGRKIDAFVLAPQNPRGSWNPSKINDLLEWTKTRYAIDIPRVYVVGMSMGGYGTIDFAGTYPEKVAAAMALCGGGSQFSPHCGLTKVPLWIIHGTADKVTPVAESQKVVNAMKECGDTTLLRFDRLKGVNHSKPARFFYWEKTYEWLFAHSLTDSVRFVNRDFVAADALHEAYLNLDRTVNKVTVIDKQAKKTGLPRKKAKKR